MRFLRSTFLSIALVLILVTSAFGAITFTYTESTNITVQTEGTSGTPATFADFVTADRAGTDTDLLVAGTPAADLALTYAVRPVEDLAILVKCVVANKTAEADFIFITGTDWRGAAQTESIDVTAGDGSYTSTKYWSAITTLDCSDNAAGGGTVWADGDLSVTQDVWGVIWDKGGSQYQIDCILHFGNASTTSFFTSKGAEQVHFSEDSLFTTTAEATLTLGVLVGSYGTNGVYWYVRGRIWPNTGELKIVDGGTVNIYNSLIKIYGESPGRFNAGVANVYNSTLAHNYTERPSLYTRYEVSWLMTTVNFDSVFVTDVESLAIWKTFDVYNDVWIHNSSLGFGVYTSITFIGANITSAATHQIDMYHISLDKTAYFVDTQAALTDVDLRPGGAGVTLSLFEQYTCNIHVAGKYGTNLASVTALCEDKDGTDIFSVSTAADGTIAEQTISYKLFAETFGGAQTETTYSPHKFTFSKAGYVTQVHDAITVNGAIGSPTKPWHIEMQPIGYPPSPWFGMLGLMVIVGAVVTYRKRRFFH